MSAVQSARDQQTYFVNDGTYTITDDSDKKSFIETDSNCVCKTNLNNNINRYTAKTYDECEALCASDASCVMFLHSPTSCLLYSQDCKCETVP